MPFSRDEIDYFLNRKITENYTFFDSSNHSERKLEAFLLQATLLEGVLTKLLKITYQRRQLDYLDQTNINLDGTIKSLNLLKVINQSEFHSLDNFRRNRNKIIHHLLDQNYSNLETLSKRYYEDGSDVLLKMIKKLKRRGYR